MLQFLSPQYSTSSKADLFSKQRSPSVRQRIPSMQECLSSHNLKAKGDSPSEIRRRKSQHESHNLNSSNGKKPRPRNANNCTQDLITSVQDLKDQYKVLREAYKELIQEKIKNAEELNAAKQQNIALKLELDQVKSSEAALKQQVVQLEDELRVERNRVRQLQTDLYFLREREAVTGSGQKQKGLQQPQFTGSDQLQQIYCGSFSNQSNILSFSLTSVLEESLRSQDKTSRKHIKAVSNLHNINSEFQQVELRPKKESVCGNFKKVKKESLKIDLAEPKQTKETRESKALSVINPLNQLLSLKSPVASSEKKSFKAVQTSSNGKRRKQDKQNTELKGTGAKKKSKKLLLQSPLQ